MGVSPFPTMEEGFLAKYVYYQSTDSGGGTNTAMTVGDSDSSTNFSADGASSSRDAIPRSGGLARCKWVVHSLSLTEQGSKDAGKDVTSDLLALKPTLSAINTRTYGQTSPMTRRSARGKVRPRLYGPCQAYALQGCMA